MMNVYEFELLVSYGSGMAIVAAPTKDDAIAMASRFTTYGGLIEWKYKRKIPLLTYNGKKKKVLAMDYYTE